MSQIQPMPRPLAREAARTEPASLGLTQRPRRNRKAEWSRRLVRETALRPSQLVLPMFTVAGEGIDQPVDALPGVSRLSPDMLVIADATNAVAVAGVMASVQLNGVDSGMQAPRRA